MSWEGVGDGEDNPFADPAVQAAAKSSGGGGAVRPATSVSPPPPPPTAEPPSWLKSNTSPVNVPPPPGPTRTSPQPPPAPTQAAPAPTPAPARPGVTPKLVYYMRAANLILAALMIVSALLTIITANNFQFAGWVLAFYVMFFSCLLCCFEVPLKQTASVIANNFGFLFNGKSRAVFLIFVGALCFSLGIMGKIIGSFMCANAFFNMFVLWKYPEFEKYRPATAQEEAANYMRNNPQVVQRGVNMAVDQARKNPDLAKAAVQGAASGGQAGANSWV